jgi:hypothetical protein
VKELWHHGNDQRQEKYFLKLLLPRGFPPFLSGLAGYLLAPFLSNCSSACAPAPSAERDSGRVLPP